MKKVFISLPIANKPIGEIKYEIDRRKTALQQLRFQVIDSFIEKDVSVLNFGLWCLGKSLETMSDCDIAYFCKGWNKARGCLVEYEAAVQYGLQVITED